jgi:V8-like Glu-specific endopeptidase
MVSLTTVEKPSPSPAFESAEAAPAAPAKTPGHEGAATSEVSRSREHLVAVGKSDAPIVAYESVIGEDERVRIVDTDLPPWRMICALRMRGPSGAGAIGTGWFIGPKTVLTAGHCVFSNHFFGGWASSIEVIPGLVGPGTDPKLRPYGSVTSERLASVDRWIENEDADFDMGCIHLDEAKGDEVGWFALGALSPEELTGYRVNVSGYPADRGGGFEQYHAANRVLSVTDRRVFYEVDTYGGQSGAPVWVHETEDSPPLAVAIHAYGIGGTPANMPNVVANSAPRILPEVLDKLTEWVEQDGGWPSG